MAGIIAVISPEKRIEENAYDVDAWNILLREAHKSPSDQARPFYEKLINQFPNAGRYWKAYIEHELRGKNFENVEKLFQRCLIKVLNIDLWKCYLHYVRETKSHLPTFREKMAQAYDFALEKVGLDFHSYQIYAEYISFLKGVQAVGQYAENQKITAIRKVYQRGIITPLLNIEQLWAEYCNFEKSVNQNLAERLISEKNKEYQHCKKISKNLELVTRGLNRQLVSVPPRATPSELKQIDLWKQYISWEKGNPLQTEDYSLFSKRTVYSYEQALLCLGYHPDMWYEAAMFIQEASRVLAEKGDKLSHIYADDVAALYDRAVTTLLKDNLLMYFAFADYEEERMKFEKVEGIYQKLIDLQNIDPTLGYIHYMKFSRRTKGIKAARTVFKRAREDPRSKYHVYVSAALMEYYCSKDSSVAMRIFELGLKKYGDQAEFALAFIEFLSHLNEDNNTRVLFERILTSGSLAPEKSLEIWDRYLEFETQVGDLASILKVDKRRREALENQFHSIQTLLLIDRYKFLDLLPCSPDQLRLLGYAQKGTIAGGGADKQTTGTSSAPVRGPTGLNVGISAYPEPDVDQMIPFKPKIITTSSYHPVAGGVFPPPPAVAHLMSMLPPPWCFNGPFVSVDMLMEKFRTFQLPSDAPMPSAGEDGKSTNGSNHKMDEIKKEFYQLLATTPDPMQLLSQEALHKTTTSRKRHHRGGDSDDEDAAATPPTNDIYRLRQMQSKKTAF